MIRDALEYKWAAGYNGAHRPNLPRALILEDNAVASNAEIEKLSDERCPDCGSGFAKDLKGSGYRRHLEKRPKRDRKTNEVLKDALGNPILCGGTPQSWGKGGRS